MQEEGGVGRGSIAGLGGNLPLVSVIVPTRNAAGTIERTLQSLSSQTYKDIEVILVDNHSSDDTRQIASRFPFVIQLVAGPERSAQVNAGVGSSHGRYVYRIDQDFVLEPTVIEEAVRLSLSERVDTVLIHNTSDPTVGFWAKVRKLERDCYRESEMHVAARFFTREAFSRAGGFNSDLIAAEDYDLHNRLLRAGAKVGRIRAEEIHIGEPRSLKEVVEKHVYYGTKIREFLEENPVKGWRQVAPFRVEYVRHWRDFLADPKVSLGFLLYQYVRYASAFAGFLADMRGE